MKTKTLLMGCAALALLFVSPAMAGNMNTVNIGATIGQTLSDSQGMVSAAAAHADTSYGWADKVDASALGANIGNDGSITNVLTNDGNDQNWQASVGVTVTASQGATLTGETAAANALAESPSGVNAVTAEATALNLGNITSVSNTLSFTLSNAVNPP